MSQDTKPPQSATERMRLYRKRQRRGLRCVRIQIGCAEIDGLIAKGYLARSEKEDIKALEFAATSFISDTLLGF